MTEKLVLLCFQTQIRAAPYITTRAPSTLQMGQTGLPTGATAVEVNAALVNSDFPNIVQPHSDI